MTIKGAASPLCFFARLAVFFSFGVSDACFFTSLLDFWDLDIVSIPDHGERIPNERWDAGLTGSFCPDDPPGPAPLSAVAPSSTLAGKVSDNAASMNEASSGIAHPGCFSSWCRTKGRWRTRGYADSRSGRLASPVRR